MAESSEHAARLLASLARKAAERSGFFASILVAYAGQHVLDDQQLAAQLGCDGFTLDRLRLCKRPDPEPFAFALDINRIAEALSLDAGLLASIVREVDALADLERVNAAGATPFSSTPGLLSAARDRDEPHDLVAGEQEPGETAGSEQQRGKTGEVDQ